MASLCFDSDSVTSNKSSSWSVPIDLNDEFSLSRYVGEVTLKYSARTHFIDDRVGNVELELLETHDLFLDGAASDQPKHIDNLHGSSYINIV